jgi:ClpP class serine protease
MSEAKDQIAIIYAQGGGEGDVNAEGSMRRSLQEARKIKMSIVLIIDSPGGSAFNL